MFMNEFYVRAYASETIIFREAIIVYNENLPNGLHSYINTNEGNRVIGHLILDFKLNFTLEYNDFIIYPSEEIHFSPNNSVKKGFVSMVRMPKRINFPSSHLFTQALSALCSFAFERPVLSPRNDFDRSLNTINSNGLLNIALEWPRTIAGPGSNGSTVHSSVQVIWKERLIDILKKIDILKNLDHSIYFEMMRTIRLIHLAHINHRNDFDLSFSMLISAIESIATKAIPEIKIQHHLDYQNWKKKSFRNRDEETQRLYKEYHRLKEVERQILNGGLSNRFTEFIMKSKPKDYMNEVLINRGF